MVSDDGVSEIPAAPVARLAYPGMALNARARRAVHVTEMFAPRDVDPPVRVLVYRPKKARGLLPLVLRVHGGGFVAFEPETFAATDAAIAQMGATVVSVDYRLAPMHRFPAALDDCYAALCWAYETLEIDRDRVVVTGSSAGGALAAGVSLLARDRSGPSIRHQSLHVPVLDARLSTPSMRQCRSSREGFTREAAAEMWRNYLPPGTDRSRTPPYASPSRATNLAGLPSTFIQVNEMDPLRDEGLVFAQRLLNAGVQVELYCAPGIGHGAVSSESPMADGAQRIFDTAMKRALVR
jgi:acetyl esterase/lipase